MQILDIFEWTVSKGEVELRGISHPKNEADNFGQQSTTTYCRSCSTFPKFVV